MTASARPEKSVFALSQADLWLGEMLQLDPPREPGGSAEADLLADCFWACFREEPEFLELPPPERTVNSRLLRWVSEQPGWAGAKAHTACHVPASLAAAPALWASLLREDALKAALKEQDRAARKARWAETEEREAAALRLAAGAAEAAGRAEEAAQMRARAAEHAALAESRRWEAEALARSAAGTLESWAEGDPLRAKAALAAAARKAAEEAARAVEACAGWGFGPGALSRLDPQAALELSRRLRKPALKEIARLAGRLKRAALSARRSRVAAGEIPWGLGRTADLRDALPEELAWLAPPARPLLRARKAAEWAVDGLPGIVRRGEAKEAGPFFAAVDASGSMRGARETCAKALALALTQIAREGGRDFMLAAFSSGGDPLLTVSADEAARDPAALLRWAERSLGGGTDFGPPLLAAAEWIRGREGADLIFVSDGEAVPPEDAAREWIRLREETGARLLFVAVARGYGGLDRLADRVISVRELLPETAEGAAAEIGRWMR
jgi:uncharacterized protein with von Willebrand factor type A (vWA) domain